MARKRIVIADDDPGIQDIFKLILEKAGYETIVFAGGKEILQDADLLPDIYILDKQLSGMDGLEVCENLKKNSATRNIPVIMVSATPGIGEMASAAGADSFIEKPFVKRELLEMIARYI
jgi:CheY-like chemotaxis protein